ncbi:MAG: hypothetical protein ACHQ2F_00880 [Desulfobaccales bacterium]
MLQLTKFDQTDYEHYPCVENLFGDVVPLIAQVKMALPYEGWYATVVVDGNGILVMIYNGEDEQRMVFCRELYPFPLAVLVAEHLEEPLDPQVLTRLGFEQFK